MSDRLAGYECLIKGGFGCSSLWLGEDHLLYVEGFGLFLPVNECYLRYAYPDIVSVVVAPTSVRSLATLWCGGVALLAAGSLVAILMDSSLPGYRTILVVLAVMALLSSLGFLLRNLRHGPTCVCELSTAVSRFRPRPLRRVRTARPALERLQSRIDNAADESRKTVAERKILRPSAERPWLSSWVVPAFAINLGLAVWLAMVIALGWDSSAAAVFSSILEFGAALTLSLALAATTRRPAPIEPRMQLWALLGPLAVLGVAAMICYSIFSFTDPGLISGSLGFTQMLGSLSTEMPNSVTIFFLLVCALLAAFSACGWWFSSRRGEGLSTAEENSASAVTAAES